MILPEVLRSFAFFAELSESQLKSLSIIADKHCFQRGDIIFKEDDPAHTLFLVWEGWVDITLKTSDWSTRCELVTTLTHGDVFGWSAVVEPYIYTASAVCASPVSTIGLKGADLLALFQADPVLCCVVTNKICQVIAHRLHATCLQMASLFVLN